MIKKAQVGCGLKNRHRQFFFYILVSVKFIVFKAYLFEKNHTPHSDCSKIWAVSKYLTKIAILSEIYWVKRFFPRDTWIKKNILTF